MAYTKSVGPGGKAIPAIVRRAQNGAGADGHDTSPMQRYDGLKLSSPVKVNSRAALILGARAVPMSLYNNSFGPVLFEQDGYSVVALDTAQDPSWSELVMHESDRPLIVNPSNGRLEIVTGTLLVKLVDIKEADRLGGLENLQLLSVDEAINVAYYRAPENFHLLAGAEHLSKNPTVRNVEIEVVKAIKGVR